MNQFDERLSQTIFSLIRRFPAGALLIEAGGPAERVYLLRSGQVRVFRLTESGHETTTAVLGPGQFIGLTALLAQATHRAFAEALTEVEAWMVEAERLLERLSQDAYLAELVLDGLGRRLLLAEGLLRDVALLPVAQRLPDAVRRLASCLDGEAPRLRQSDLAALVGARPETVSRVTARSRAGREGRLDGGPV
jgi:CRP/FNR family transcriptional regulator